MDATNTSTEQDKSTTVAGIEEDSSSFLPSARSGPRDHPVSNTGPFLDTLGDDSEQQEQQAEEDEDNWSRQVETDEDYHQRTGSVILNSPQQAPPTPPPQQELTLKEQQILRERQRRLETQRATFKRQFLNSEQIASEEDHLNDGRHTDLTAGNSAIALGADGRAAALAVSPNMQLNVHTTADMLTLNQNLASSSVGVDPSATLEEASVVAHPDADNESQEPPLGFNMERFLRNSDDFQPVQEENTTDDLATPIMERFLNQPVLLDTQIDMTTNASITNHSITLDDANVSEEDGTPSVIDEQRLMMGLTEEGVQAMAAIDEASLGNAPPSEREDLSEVGELADFSSPPTHFSLDDTPSTVLESASIISANGSVAANPPSEREDDFDKKIESNVSVEDELMVDVDEKLTLEPQEDKQHVSELLGMKAAPPHTTAMLQSANVMNFHRLQNSSPSGIRNLEYGSIPVDPSTTLINGFSREDQPLLGDTPPEVIDIHTKHHEIHQSSGIRSIFSHVASEEQHDEGEAHNDSEKYARSNIVQRAFPERLFALIITMILEIPVLFMISGGSDSLCALIGRRRYQLLVGFIPLTSAISGNVGLQASSLTTRGISHEHVTVENYFVWFLKEVSAAACLGTAMGLVLGSIAFVASDNDPAFGLTIFLARKYISFHLPCFCSLLF